MKKERIRWIKDVKALHKKLGRKPKKRDSNRLYFVSRKLFGSWNKAMEAAGYEVYYYQKARVPALDENLAYYLGLLVTDGHIVKSKSKSYNLEIYTSYEEERDMLIRLIKELFDYNAFVWERNTQWGTKPGYIVSVFSKEVVNHFIDKLDIPSGNKTWTIEIPRCILESSISSQGAFVRGIIDGDGCIKVKPPYVAVSSASEKFLYQLQDMIEKCGITTNRVYQHKGRELYNLGITGRKNIYKLYKLMYPTDLDYCYPRKKKKLKTSVPPLSIARKCGWL